ncbi:hypothetical protein DFH27DRAFT_557480 [Peziza echinospora]|nr:hypothetical protein DFH27DRAFT_557480 [Peziza echinospora]
MNLHRPVVDYTFFVFIFYFLFLIIHSPSSILSYFFFSFLVVYIFLFFLGKKFTCKSLRLNIKVRIHDVDVCFETSKCPFPTCDMSACLGFGVYCSRGVGLFLKEHILP